MESRRDGTGRLFGCPVELCYEVSRNMREILDETEVEKNDAGIYKEAKKQWN